MYYRPSIIVHRSLKIKNENSFILTIRIILFTSFVSIFRNCTPPTQWNGPYFLWSLHNGKAGGGVIELNPGDLFSIDRHSLGPENPAHNVLVDSFYIDAHEVSHGEYMKFVKRNKIKEPRFANDPNFNNINQPVVGVSWKEAQSYCIWKGSRLPTEAEWEKASRGKRSIKYPWGNEDPNKSKLNFNQEIKKTTIVGWVL